MNRVEYNQYVKSIEEKFDGRPEALARKARFYVVGSYLYVAGVVLGALMLLALLVYLVVFAPNVLTIKIGLVLGIGTIALLFSIIKGLHVKTPPPDGIAITRNDAPELFVLLDDLRANVADAKFDKVLIDGDFNAAVYPRPRLGLLGWYQNSLLLGLPLMQTLNPVEFRAVLAHEFAHLSNKDGSSGNWIYRIRRSWEQILEAVMSSGGGGSWALSPFFNWFWPRFNGHAFVLSRLHEYRADAAAASYAGAEAVGTSLRRVEQYGRYLEEKAWAAIFETSNDVDVPPRDAFDQLKLAVASPIHADLAEEWVAHSFARPTDYSDTHPALKDRLQSVGALPIEIANGLIPGVLPPNSESSATVFLGPETERMMMDRLNDEWANSLVELWKDRYDEVQKIRGELGDESEVTDAEGAWKWAEAMLTLKGAEDAMPWVEKTLQFDVEHVGAKYTKGCYLVEKNDPAGVALLNEITDEEPMLGLEALGMLKMYYSNLGDTEKLHAIDRKADQFDQVMEMAQQERGVLNKTDTYLPHDLKPKLVEDIKKELSEFSYIKEVYIARKEVAHFPKSPMYAIVVMPKVKSFVKESATDFIAQCLSPLMDGAFFVILKNHNKPVAKVVCEMPDTRVYVCES